MGGAPFTTQAGEGGWPLAPAKHALVSPGVCLMRVQLGHVGAALWPAPRPSQPTATAADTTAPCRRLLLRAHRYHDVTKILIDAGADVNTSTATSTPLTEAVKAKQAQNEAMLRQAGAKEIDEM